MRCVDVAMTRDGTEQKSLHPRDTICTLFTFWKTNEKPKLWILSINYLFKMRLLFNFILEYIISSCRSISWICVLLLGMYTSWHCIIFKGGGGCYIYVISNTVITHINFKYRHVELSSYIGSDKRTVLYFDQILEF